MITASSIPCGWCGAPLKRVDDGPWWCFAPACLKRQSEWAVAVQETTDRGKPIPGKQKFVYVPTPDQVVFHETQISPALLASLPAHFTSNGRRPRINRLYGGAAGPGKSHGERWDQYRKAMTIPNYTAVILRRTMPELRKTHLRAFARDQHIIGAEFLKSENQLVFENGSLIECGHCEDDDAKQKWLSTEYDQIGIDEGSTFEPDWLAEISTRARTSNSAVKAAGGPWWDVVTNPGGRAWPLLRDLFVTHTPDFDLYPQLRKTYHPALWVYVKALLDGNPYLDESYADDLAILSESRYRQLRYGEEFVTDGAFFSQWRETKDGQPWHVRDLEIPTHVEWFASMDWGYNSPGVVLWWAALPDGHYHIAEEWKFQSMTAEEVGRGIKDINAQLGIKRLRYIACDPSMKGKTGAGKGESIFETLIRRPIGLPMQAADNDRYNGWTRCQQLLRESNAQDGPWVTIASRCRYGRRTMPAQVQDKHNPDDLDTNGDDHWADAFRYGAMSRPAPTRAVVTREAPPPVGSWGWWRDWHARQQAPAGVLAI